MTTRRAGWICYKSPLLLFLVCAVFFVDCTCTAPSPPGQKSCFSERQKLKHPSWRRFLELSRNRAEGLDACLQMAWKKDAFVEGKAQLVR